MEKKRNGPAHLPETNHVEPVPRRIRALLGGEVVVDTLRARYVWEWPAYPQFYIPVDDVRSGVLVAEGGTESTPRGDVESYGLRAGDIERPKAAKVLQASTIPELTGTVRFDWSALDAWFEEDEQVFGHPRDPYVRVDALRSTRRVRVEIDGVVLADTSSPVMVFETGLPTRYYINRTDVRWSLLDPTGTITLCPYKGRTSQGWSARAGGREYPEVAWAYDFPMRELLPIAGLVAFYNEKVDIFVDGVARRAAVGPAA